MPVDLDLDVMEPPIFSSLTHRDNWIKNILPGFIEQGASGAYVMRVLKTAKVRIRRQDFYRLHRHVLGIEEQANRVRYVPRGKIPSEDIFQPLEQYQPEKYFYVADYEIIDPETGEVTIEQYGMASNIRVERDVLEQAIYEQILKDYPELAERMGVVSLRKAFISPNV